MRVVDPDGIDRTPASKKGKALIALLALSPGREKSRWWLQNKLWSQQPPQQRAASLRQCLSSLRKSFGPYKSSLKTEREMVFLDGDVDDTATGDVLEGVAINDPEFLEWLADQMLLAAKPNNGSVEVLPEGTAIPRVRSKLEDGDGSSAFLAALVADSVMQRLSEAGSIETLEAKGCPSQKSRLEFTLCTAAMKRNKTAGIRIRVEAANSGAVIWTGHRVLKSDGIAEVESADVRRLMNHAVDAAIHHYGRLRPSGSAKSQSSALCFRAVSKMLSLQKPELHEAESMLKQASAIDAQGIYLAWQAYLKIIQFGERLVDDKAMVAEEATELLSDAMEQGVGNSMVLALASYVQSILFKNYHTAHELAADSLKISSINPLAWAFAGVAKLHLGALEEAHRCTSYAKTISGHGPQRYQLNMLACQTALVTGRYEEAIRLAEATAGMAPNYLPPKRYLAALLINADREDEARNVISNLKEYEPDFSFDHLSDLSYPASALRLSPLGVKIEEFSLRVS